jgi:hypothetical protein
MEKKENRAIISVAIIWGIIIFSSAVVLKDTNYFSDISTLLAAGAAVCIIILGGVFRRNK